MNEAVATIDIDVELTSFEVWLIDHIRRNYSALKLRTTYPTVPPWELTKNGIDPWNHSQKFSIGFSFNSIISDLSLAKTLSPKTLYFDITQLEEKGIRVVISISEPINRSYLNKLITDIKQHWREELIERLPQSKNLSLEEKGLLLLKRLYDKVKHDTEVAISVFELGGNEFSREDALQTMYYLIGEGLAKPGQIANGLPDIRITLPGIKKFEVNTYKSKTDTSSLSIKIEGDYIMGTKNTEVRLGDNATIHGNFVVASSIQESFNKAVSANMSKELKELIKDLSVAVGKMSEVLPEEEAKRVARALETLTDEAISEKPDQQWWEVSVEGLTKAARDIGQVGKPVLEIVAQLIPILTQKSG